MVAHVLSRSCLQESMHPFAAPFISSFALPNPAELAFFPLLPSLFVLCFLFPNTISFPELILFSASAAHCPLLALYSSS